MGKNQSNKLETWGNETTMNMNAILYQNILASPYFKSLYEKKTFHEIVDEIYNEVTNLAPFIKGTTVSTAFCCLFKFWTLRLTVKQLENLIDHRDSPYIRAIGFLYLRYVCAPAELWEWLSYYLEDEEEIELSGGPRPQKSTIGKLCRMLLTEQKFQGTMLPRIPVPIARDLDKKLKEYDQEMRNGGHGEYEEEEQQDRSHDRRRYDDDEEDDRRSYRRQDHSYDRRDRSYDRRDRSYDRRRDDDRGYYRRDRSRSPYDRRRRRDDDDYRRSRYDDDDRDRRYRHRSRSRDRYSSRSYSRDRNRY
ncbi:PRP38-domain-containing protein [Lichtheimia hyalospora FSU 10163]|nr:PRP38-domain-containing protein [Lichtheimia hyalospora FSU 10163]